MRRCNGKTKAGAPCRAPAGPDGFCFFHGHPDKAHALGQIGGRKNRSRLPEPPPAGSLTAADLRDILVDAIRDVRSKRMPPRVASALSQLCNSAHRLLQTADLENRLAKLEQQLAELASPTAVDSDPARSRVQEEPCGGTETQPDDADTPKSGDGAEGSKDGSNEGGKE